MKNLIAEKQLIKSSLFNSLVQFPTLSEAFEHLEFVQADPIRSPARSQDLVLRNRVANYKQGDIDESYANLDLQEDFLYAHGFMQRDLWQLLHPRTSKSTLSEYDKEVFEAVQTMEVINPKELSLKFGNTSERNWWGGKSQATKMSLERLYYYGFIKIVKRENGLRVYAPFTSAESGLTEKERLQKVILAIVDILAPVTSKTLNQSLFRLRNYFGSTKETIQHMVKDGILIKEKVDDIDYLWRPDRKLIDSPLDTVKFLSPFDPVVWDRIRFEHIWGWQYRFEAYVPKEKRVRGYYAMPLLWRDDIIGWANVDKQAHVELGFINGRPQDPEFSQALDAEINSMRNFLKIKTENIHETR